MYSVKFPFNNSNQTGEKLVNGTLAITPSQMERLTREGKSIQLHALDGSMYYDDMPDCTDITDVPIEYRRGMDENDAWEASVTSNEKLRKFKMHQNQEVNNNNPVNIS